jgi:hypothetical protein
LNERRRPSSFDQSFLEPNSHRPNEGAQPFLPLLVLRKSTAPTVYFIVAVLADVGDVVVRALVGKAAPVRQAVTVSGHRAPNIPAENAGTTVGGFKQLWRAKGQSRT